MNKVFLHILTTTTAPDRVEEVRGALKNHFRGEKLQFLDFKPYWKIEGWGEISVTMETALPLKNIQNTLARHWGSDTASDGIYLPHVGFLWAGTTAE